MAGYASEVTMKAVKPRPALRVATRIGPGGASGTPAWCALICSDALPITARMLAGTVLRYTAADHSDHARPPGMQASRECS
jgi:hypothetical protein